MFKWVRIALVASSVGIFSLFLSFLIFRKLCNRRKHVNDHFDDDHVDQERAQSFQTGISRLHQVSHEIKTDSDNKKTNVFLAQRGVSRNKGLFNWSEHPSIVNDVVENGWSRFGFLPQMSSSAPVRSAGGLFGDQATREMGVETTWEICQGSADFVQIISLHNQGLKETVKGNHDYSNINLFGAASVFRTALPLPGPTLAYSSFPQEAYFEITILFPRCYSVDNEEVIGKMKEDRIKLIKGDNFNARMSNSESLVHVLSDGSYRNKGIDEMKHAGNGNGKNEGVVLSVGLSGGGSFPMRFPGSYPGSIGFNSNGSVLLDGIKLVLDSKTQEWGKPNMVIGCGYSPIKKSVFFTVDSQLVHEIHCKSDVFSAPLYPTLAANSDTTLLVNLGQCIFKYAPANRHRTPNPCFVGSMSNSPSLGFDSKELFSMGRLDPQWLNRTTTRSNATSNGTAAQGFDSYGEESESELFEITLDRSGKSPHTHQ